MRDSQRTRFQKLRALVIDQCLDKKQQEDRKFSDKNLIRVFPGYVGTALIRLHEGKSYLPEGHQDEFIDSSNVFLPDIKNWTLKWTEFLESMKITFIKKPMKDFDDLVVQIENQKRIQAYAAAMNRRHDDNAARQQQYYDGRRHQNSNNRPRHDQRGNGSQIAQHAHRSNGSYAASSPYAPNRRHNQNSQQPVFRPSVAPPQPAAQASNASNASNASHASNHNNQPTAARGRGRAAVPPPPKKGRRAQRTEASKTGMSRIRAPDAPTASVPEVRETLAQSRRRAWEDTKNAGLVRTSNRSTDVGTDGTLRVDTKDDAQKRADFHRARDEQLRNTPAGSMPVDDDVYEDNTRLNTDSKFQSEIDSLKRTINELVLRSQYGVSANPVNSSLHTSLQGQFHDFF